MPSTRTLLSGVLGLALLVPLFGSMGCIVHTEPRRGYHRHRNNRGPYHCHRANGPRRRQICHYVRH
jgi:hypothetical protein